MSIEEAGQIDIVASHPDQSEVRLVISDDLDWTDPHQHCLLLQEKLNSYIAFIETGQLWEMENTPGPEQAVPVSIEVVALHEPPATVQPFLQQVSLLLDDLDINFRHRVRSKDP